MCNITKYPLTKIHHALLHFVILRPRLVDFMMKYHPGSSRVGTNNADRNYEEDVWRKTLKITALSACLWFTRGTGCKNRVGRGWLACTVDRKSPVCVPVVLPRIHLRVLHSVLLGEEHEGIHWPFAFCWRGTAGCPWGVPPVWFTCWGLWRAGALEFVTVWADGTPTRQGGPALAGHAAQNVHGWGI